MSIIWNEVDIMKDKSISEFRDYEDTIILRRRIIQLHNEITKLDDTWKRRKKLVDELNNLTRIYNKGKDKLELIEEWNENVIYNHDRYYWHREDLGREFYGWIESWYGVLCVDINDEVDIKNYFGFPLDKPCNVEKFKNRIIKRKKKCLFEMEQVLIRMKESYNIEELSKKQDEIFEHFYLEPGQNSDGRIEVNDIMYELDDLLQDIQETDFDEKFKKKSD